MASQKVLDGIAALITIGAALVSWSHYYPATPMIERLGLPGPRANTGRSCGAERLGHTWGTTPTRNILCQRARSVAGFGLLQEVNVDALTRRVTHARRDLVPADSAAWAAERDSVRDEMLRAGGEPIPCYEPFGSFLPWIPAIDAWRFSDYSIRLTAYHWTPRRLGPSAPPRWLLQMDGYAADPPDCGPGGVPHIPPGSAPPLWSSEPVMIISHAARGS